MEKSTRSPFTILRNAMYIFLALWVLMAAPTGWIYDLWVGKGMEQGQWPGEEVLQLHQQEDIESFLYTHTPTTIGGGNLVVCPLARLRDATQEGEHQRSHRKSSVYISKYIVADYPLSLWEQTYQSFLGGSTYNRYHLVELEDGSWLCIYFDDYLSLMKSDTYPIGYVRYTTTEERQMLNQMVEDYDVNPVYVLDMYQHGKVNWMLDDLLRLAVCAAAAVIVRGIEKAVSKYSLPTRGK